MLQDTLNNLGNHTSTILDTLMRNDTTKIAEVVGQQPGQNYSSLDYIALIVTSIAALITIVSFYQSLRLKKLISSTNETAIEAKHASENANTAAQKAEDAAVKTVEAACDAKNASNEAQKASEEAKKASLETIKTSSIIETLTLEIADYTRKPLEGIEDVLFQIHKMFKNFSPGSTFWYLGFTLGIGHAHKVDKIINLWDKKKSDPDYIDYSTMIDNLKRKIMSSIGGAKDMHIVCLNKARVEEDFIKPLYNKKYNILDTKIISSVAKNVNKKHEEIESVIESKGKEIHYIDTLPIQIIMTDIKKNGGDTKRAVIVFHVGTANIGSKVLGFYSELPSIYVMFQDYIESLCNKH